MMRKSETMAQQKRAGPPMAGLSLVLGISGTENSTMTAGFKTKPVELFPTFGQTVRVVTRGKVNSPKS